MTGFSLTTWRAASSWFQPEIPASLSPYLLDAGSSTKWLRQAYGKTLKIQVLSQGWQALTRSEEQCLNLRPRSYALVREVAIYGKGNCVMLGRSVFPASILTGKTKSLAHYLDERPLGELLFQYPSLQRSEFELALLQPSNIEYAAAQPYLANKSPPLWARRSIFYIDEKPMLLTEIFLPKLLAWCSKKSQNNGSP